MTELDSSSIDVQPLMALVWDQGALSKDAAIRFTRLVDEIGITKGPNQSALAQTLASKLGSEQGAVLLESDPHSPAEMLNLIQQQGLPQEVSFVLAGSPFDPELWVKELLESLESSHQVGIGFVIPGPASGPVTVVALNKFAVEFVDLARAGLAHALGSDLSGGPTSLNVGVDAAISVIRDQIGDVVLLYSSHPYTGSPSVKPPPVVGAADTVHVVMKDMGLEVSNRTAMTTELRVHLGSPGGRILETLHLVLNPRESRWFESNELGVLANLAPPVPELRQWSHEAEVVFEGGDRRIHLVEVHYFEPGQEALADSQGNAPIGTDTFGSVDSVNAGTISTEISRAIGTHSSTAASRMAELAKRPGWRMVIRMMVCGPDQSGEQDEVRR